MADFYIRQNDTAPDLQVTLKDGDNEAVNVTGATVIFSMSYGGISKVSQQSASLVTAASGVVKYEWQAGDTDTPGLFEGEFEVTYSGGKVETFPNSDAQRLNIHISEELA